MAVLLDFQGSVDGSWVGCDRKHRDSSALLQEVKSLPPENFMREHVDFDVKVAGDAARRRLPAPGEFYHLAVMDARGNGNLNLLASLRHSRPAALRAGTLRNLPAPVAAPAFPKAREGTEKRLARLAQDALPPARRTFFKSASRGGEAEVSLFYGYFGAYR